MVEVIISATIGTFILAGVITVFLMIGRSSFNVAGYGTMDAEARRGLETFSIDARMASDIKWNSSSSVTLTVSGAEVTYVYDNNPLSPTAGCFYRQAGTSDPEILIRDVSDFAFCRYKVVNGVDYTASNDLETKQIQITMRAVRNPAGSASASNAVLSARIVLRNKKVST